MASSATGFQSDFFYVGTFKGAGLSQPFLALSTISDTCDNGRCQRTNVCFIKWRMVHSRLLKCKDAASNTYFKTTCPKFDHLILCAL